MLDILAIVVSLLAMGLSAWNNFRGSPRTPTPKDYFYICDVKNCGFKINGPTANEVQLVGKVHYLEHHAANDRAKGESLAEWEKDLVVEHEHQDVSISTWYDIDLNTTIIELKCPFCQRVEKFEAENSHILYRCEMAGGHIWDEARSELIGVYARCRNCGLPSFPGHPNDF